VVNRVLTQEEAVREEQRRVAPLLAERDAWKALAEARGVMMITWRAGVASSHRHGEALARADKALADLRRLGVIPPAGELLPGREMNQGAPGEDWRSREGGPG